MHKNLENIFSLKEKLLLLRGCGLLGLKHAEAVIEADGIPILFDINQSLIDKDSII